MDFIHNPDYKKIFSFHAAIRDQVIARESGWLEFKESFDWLSKDKYVKSMAAFLVPFKVGSREVYNYGTRIELA